MQILTISCILPSRGDILPRCLNQFLTTENVGIDTNFTLTGQLFQIIEYFTFLPLEAVVNQFSTYVLISFDSITRFQSSKNQIFIILA